MSDMLKSCLEILANCKYLRLRLDERKMGEERKWEERKQGGRKTEKKM